MPNDPKLIPCRVYHRHWGLSAWKPGCMLVHEGDGSYQHALRATHITDVILFTLTAWRGA